MKTLSSFDSPAFSLEPVAPWTGPFTGPHFLEAWWRHRGHGELIVAESRDAVFTLVVGGGEVVAAGEADLTDYHSPRGEGAQDLVRQLARELGETIRWRCDSLPAEAAAVVAGGLEAAGFRVLESQHAGTAVVELPSTFDEYLSSLGKKERHEVRRKLRRFMEALGEPTLVTGWEFLDEFFVFHRRSPGRKGQFMTSDLEEFFRSLADVPGARLDTLLAGGGPPVAVAYGFEDGAAYYGYNAAYDPEVAAASPGQVLQAELVRALIGRGMRRFDFLKGDEKYKFRAGATARPLYEVRTAP